jgi:aminoglycoside 2'-N-acetyltransferase I
VSLEDPATAGWTLQVAHTSQVDTLVLAAARALLDEAFGGDFDDFDWEHALGGIHALAWDEGELVGHGAVVQRRLSTAGGRCAPGTSRASPCVPTGGASSTDWRS